MKKAGGQNPEYGAPAQIFGSSQPFFQPYPSYRPLLAFVLSVYDMDICSNALQSLFSQFICSNSKIGCDAEAIVLGSAQQIPVPSLQFALYES